MNLTQVTDCLDKNTINHRTYHEPVATLADRSGVVGGVDEECLGPEAVVDCHRHCHPEHSQPTHRVPGIHLLVGNTVLVLQREEDDSKPAEEEG